MQIQRHHFWSRTAVWETSEIVVQSCHFPDILDAQVLQATTDEQGKEELRHAVEALFAISEVTNEARFLFSGCHVLLGIMVDRSRAG